MAASQPSFVPATKRTQAVVVLFLVFVALSVLAVASDVVQLGLLYDGAFTMAQLEASDDRQITFGNLTLLSAASVAVAFLFWIHRAYRNAMALNPMPLRYSLGWSVGAWFTPVLCLWRPVQIVKDIWHASDPQPAAPSTPIPNRSSPALLGWWWAGWLVIAISERFVYGLGNSVQSLEDAQAATWVWLAYDLLSGAIAILAVSVVAVIYRRQIERAQHLSLLPPYANGQNLTPAWFHASVGALLLIVLVIGGVGIAASADPDSAPVAAGSPTRSSPARSSTTVPTTVAPTRTTNAAPTATARPAATGVILPATSPPTALQTPRPVATLPPATASLPRTVQAGAWVASYPADGECRNIRESPSLGAAVLNCIPVGFTVRLAGAPRAADGYTWWQTDEGGWIAVDDTFTIQNGPPARSSALPTAVVQEFYQLVSLKRYDAAYQLMSTGLRRQQPFASWQAGYRSTESIRIERVATTASPLIVDISVVAVDALPTGRVSRRFSGTVELVQEAGGWRIDRARVREAP